MVKFDSTTHTYTLNGEVIPSTTQIIKTVLFPNQYAFINDDVLEKAANFGTRVHKALDMDFPEALDDQELHCYNEAKRILKENNLSVISKENIVYSKLGYAGTYDLIASNEKIILIDYKTTSKVYEDSVSWQLSMYKNALEEMGEKIDELKVIHLPKNKKGKLVSIEIKHKIEIEWLVKTYYERTTNE